jgi:catalase
VSVSNALSGGKSQFDNFKEKGGKVMDKKLTNNVGAPVADNQNVMTAGPRGPMLLQDAWFLEKLAHFDREVIPERRMHAKGSAARLPSHTT